MITFTGTHYHETILTYGPHDGFIMMEGAWVMRGYAFPLRQPAVSEGGV